MNEDYNDNEYKTTEKIKDVVDRYAERDMEVEEPHVYYLQIDGSIIPGSTDNKVVGLTKIEYETGDVNYQVQFSGIDKDGNLIEPEMAINLKIFWAMYKRKILKTLQEEQPDFFEGEAMEFFSMNENYDIFNI